MNWGKLGEIGFNDEHTLLTFPAEDRPYIQNMYIDKLVLYNVAIDETLDELIESKKQIDKMIHYKNNKKLLWSYFHKTKLHANDFYVNFNRLENHFENLLRERSSIMQNFHDNAMKYHNDQTVQDEKFSPIDTAQNDDLVVQPGISMAAKQITSETFKKWEFCGLGRSLTPVAPDQNKLIDEITRFYIKSHGSFASIGDLMRLLIISPGDIPEADVGELCVANAQSGGDILFRVVLDKLVHYDPDTNFLCNSSNIYMVSRI